MTVLTDSPTDTRYDPVAARKLEATDPIALEMFRNRLESIADDAAMTIERTGVSPTATETHDLSATLLDAQGNLIAGGGHVAYHWVAATNAVRATIERYGEGIASGDVYFANDPYNGGGLHPNDVFVERPIFVDGRLVAWVALSAHLADMGGMARGSFAPTATECYQEAFRAPSVRLFRKGKEVTDVWDLLRTNVRMAMVVEMDLRALVAGAHVAQEKLAELVRSVGIDFFVEAGKALCDLTERELRKRISAMADGVYRATGWAEWEDKFYKVPCELTIVGDRMIFDFEGAAPQAPHFFNSQPYIIKSAMVMLFARVMAADLPYTEGLLAPIEMRCPKGSVVHALPPAPMNAGHMHVGMTAAELMMQCVRFALWASSPALPQSSFVHGLGGMPGISLAIWSGTDVDGQSTVWGPIDGTYSGGSAGTTRDGVDMAVTPVGQASSASTADVEVLESWYPILITERSVRHGMNGVGAHRSGGGAQLKVQPYGTDQLEGQMLGLRERLPLEGAGGGRPGSTTIYEITRSDGSVERISTKAAGVVLYAGETFWLRTGSSGGVGDPLRRLPQTVADDVAIGLITAEQAKAAYGVVLDEGVPDLPATEQERTDIRAERLAQAVPPVHLVEEAAIADTGDANAEELPLHLNVVRRGKVAYVKNSGTPLAIAPYHWTDGCAVLEEHPDGPGPAITIRTYLDPRTGMSLYVEVVPAGEPRSFEISPACWAGTAN
jgi:N-methylhydantoinase B